MKRFGFLRFFIKHVIEAWLLYLLLLVASLYLIFFDNNRIVEGLCLSFIAAYIFFALNDLFVRYKKEKQGLCVSQGQFTGIVHSIQNSLRIIDVFPKKNGDCKDIPTDVQYFKDGKSKNFFVPAIEIMTELEAVKKHYNLIREQNMQLPVELMRDANLIMAKVDELINYLNSSIRYNKSNIKCTVKMYSSFECISKELQKLCNNVGKYYKIWKPSKLTLMTESEKEEYIKQNQETLKQIPAKLLQGYRLYKGTNRVA